MGYEVHVTRKADWFDDEGPAITLIEWQRLIDTDPEMRLDGYAETGLPDGEVLRIDDPTMAVWVAHPHNGDVTAWMWLSNGNVQAKNPDRHMLVKMRSIADSLGAKLQGDEGELYDHAGQQVSRQEPTTGLHPNKKPWWRLW